jgi:hypothetical protein
MEQSTIPVAYTRASPEENLKIYMFPPQGVNLTAEEEASGRNKPVLKLLKNLYGLKQAGLHQCSSKPRRLDTWWI